MKKKLLLLLTICFCILPVSGCKIRSPKICYTIYPIQYLVEKIAGDKVQSCKIGSEEIAIRSQIKDDWKEQLSDADLFLYLGQVEPYLQIYLPEIRQIEDLEIIDLANTTSIYTFKRYTTVTVGESQVVVESPYYDSSVFKTIDTYDRDPYIWLDPIAMTSVANQIRNWLVKNYPEESEYFNSRYADIETSLARLDSEYQMLHEGNSQIKVVTMSPSFGTWQKNYGIMVYPVILSRYGVLPSDEQLSFIKERIEKDEVKYILKEANMTDDMLQLYETLKDDLDLVEVNMSNLSSLTTSQKNENKDYIQVMYDNLTSLEGIR